MSLCFLADPCSRQQGGQRDPGPERHDQQGHADPTRAAGVANEQAGIVKKAKTQDRLHAGWIGGRKNLPAGSMILGPRAGSRGKLDTAARKFDPKGPVRARLHTQNVPGEISARRDRKKGDEKSE